MSDSCPLCGNSNIAFVKCKKCEREICINCMVWDCEIIQEGFKEWHHYCRKCRPERWEFKKRRTNDSFSLDFNMQRII